MINRFVVAAVVLVTLSTVTSCFGGGDSPPDADDLKVLARAACKGFVKDELKAPSTADFSDERVKFNGLTYTVRGKVDAENSFGAKVRSSYKCEVMNSDGAGDSWELVSITGLD